MTKPLPISKRMVWNSYQKVVSRGGSAGIDRQSIELFNEQMEDNLYKLWNRLSSGSYFPPPLRTVLIPKKQGGQRSLGIPTVSDRIAQGVVKDHLEPVMENVFHSSSFGYRPGRSAHDALEQCKENCKRYSWVLDVDIKGFFDNLSHVVTMRLLGQHTEEKWVLLYIERWLKAGVEQEDGTIAFRMKGTPQGGVISPLLANLYLHHAFDQWISEHHRENPFERYADDIVIHCTSREEAEQMRDQLMLRLEEFELTLHPAKTKIVYCKNHYRKEDHDNNSFTFLGYSFQPFMIKSKFWDNGRFLIFDCVISNGSKKGIRETIRDLFNPRWTEQPLELFARRLNPKIRGWLNYYGRFNKHKMLAVFSYLNELIRKWIRNKYKLAGMKALYVKYRAIQAGNATLFYHWEKGVRT